jgi:hypothetical protein
MMLLLKELAVLKGEAQPGAISGGDTARRRRMKQITRQMKQIAEEKRKSKDSK